VKVCLVWNRRVREDLSRRLLYGIVYYRGEVFGKERAGRTGLSQINERVRAWF
jgi:hypothetical protein